MYVQYALDLNYNHISVHSFSQKVRHSHNTFRNKSTDGYRSIRFDSFDI